jgi:hypothetical protein
MISSKKQTTPWHGGFESIIVLSYGTVITLTFLKASKRVAEPAASKARRKASFTRAESGD